MLQFDHQNCELDPDKSTNSDHCGCCRGFNTSCDADCLNYQVLLLLLGAMQFVFAHQ